MNKCLIEVDYKFRFIMFIIYYFDIYKISLIYLIYKLNYIGRDDLLKVC